MADPNYNTVQGLNTVNTRELFRQNDAFTKNHGVIGNEGFTRALGIAQDVMSLAGPTIGAAAPFMGMKGAAITGAAVSAFAGPGGQLGTPGFAPMGGSTVSYTAGGGKALAMPGTAPGFPGAAGGAGMPMGSSASQFDAQINAMATQQVEMLSLQARVQNISQVGQMMSNIAKTDSDAKLNAIRNIRA